MGTAMRSAFSRVPFLRPIRTGAAYEELPSHDLSPNATPLTGSPSPLYKMPEAWRKPSSRWRLGMLLRASPRRLFVITLCFFFSFLILAGGTLRTRRYLAEKEAEREAEENPYPWQRFPM